MKIDEKIRQAGLTPILDRWSSDPSDAARDMMRGRTHYYDPGTMRCFRCRVQSIRLSDNGVFMATICTQSANADHSGREYRVIAHDLTGYALERSELGEMKTRKQADKAMAELLASLDEKTVLRDAMKREKALRSVQA